jgi:hypothetical protein
MKNNNFNIYVWFKLREKLIEIEWNVKENFDLYEMIIYVMSTISDIFGTVMMQYNESMWHDRSRNAVFTSYH